MTTTPSGPDVTENRVVAAVVANRTLLDDLRFQDKPTSRTPGQQERSETAWASGEQVRTGYWECGIGTFTANRDGVHEICYVVAGRASLRDAEGSVREVGPGTLLVLPAGWQGTWEVQEPIEKMFVLVHE